MPPWYPSLTATASPCSTGAARPTTSSKLSPKALVALRALRAEGLLEIGSDEELPAGTPATLKRHLRYFALMRLDEMH